MGEECGGSFANVAVAEVEVRNRFMADDSANHADPCACATILSTAAMDGLPSPCTRAPSSSDKLGGGGSATSQGFS